MARKPRVEFAGVFYHVIVRGNQRQKIFYDGKDRLCEERGQAGFSFSAENFELKAWPETLEKLMLAKDALAQR